ncbi:hypothetical protein NODU109028_01340 [Nocardioides dubius]|uniref:Integral membrane protein n=1 Tax=Nocardioides dubius TaxID=317019 RepID=A0ABP4EFP6_9ACTN
MSNQPPYPPQDPNPGQQPPNWGQQPPPNGPGWGAPPPPPPPGWGGPPSGPPGWGQPPYGGAPGPASYSATAAIGYGWKAFTTFTGPLIVAGILALVVPGIVQGIGSVITGGSVFEASGSTDGGSFAFDFNPLALVFNIASAVLTMILSAGAIRIAFDVVDGRQPSLSTMFDRINFGQLIIASIVLGALTTLGLMLCILPGVAVMFLTYLTTYFIIGKEQDAITAIKSSVSLTAANFGAVLLFALLAVGVSVLGVLACCVGIVVAYPITVVGTAYTFRVLQSEPVAPLAGS